MKLNLVIDASSLYYRSLFTVGNFGTNKGEKLLGSRNSQGVFIRKLATDFSSLVRSIDNVARVIVCLDSQSWRKTIDIEDGGYKADRKKDESTIDWKAFYDMTDKFNAILTQKGYLISKINGAEADDLLYLWSKKLNEMGECAVLVTGDRDMLQTLCSSENGTWTIALDPVEKRKKISLTQSTLEMSTTSTSSADIFNPSSWAGSTDILEVLTKNYEINVVDTRELAMRKVILGDGGDSVPSAIMRFDEKASKYRMMTDSNLNKIFEMFPDAKEATWKDIRDGVHLESICSGMESVKKMVVDREKTLNNLKRNSILVILDEEIIPLEITDRFKTMHAQVPSLSAVSTRDGLLAGTEWWSTDSNAYVPKAFDLFE